MNWDNTEMEVTIQVGGGFHAFNLAEVLNKRKALESIITSYPRFVFDKYRQEKIPRNKFKTVPTLLIEQLFSRTPGLRELDLTFEINYIFDKIGSYRIGNPDLLVGWPGSSLYGIQKANKRDIVSVVDSDNVNIPNTDPENSKVDTLSLPDNPDDYVFQNREIEKEYEKFDYKASPVDDKYIRKSLLQYIISDYIVVPTQYVYDSMVAIGINESKIRKVPFGVNTEMFSPVDNKDPAQDDTFKIVYVGQIRLRKGVQYLLEATSELNYPDMEVILIGSVHENMSDILNEYEGEYKILGHKPQHELPEYYSQADVFVFPSVLEGFGMVIPEAMACGAPVVTTTHTGGVELIENRENGFLVPPRDVESIKKWIHYIYQNPEEGKRVGQAARKTAENRTWNDYGDEMIEMYREFMERK